MSYLTVKSPSPATRRMEVPFLDLAAQYRSIEREIDEAIRGVLRRSAFAGGPYVERFEGEFAAFCRTRQAVGVGSGTEALWLTLLALGIGRGDEVITVPNTFFATVEAILLCGARPVLVDVDERTLTMDPAKLTCAITPATRAVIPVHLFGQTADMEAILAIARPAGLAVIEDACQAHGALYRGKPAGSLGDVGCFSFYPGKNLGAYGEAGAVVSNDEHLCARVRLLRDHGQPTRYSHQLVGCNGRMDGIQAAVLSVKLAHLEAWNQARRAAAARYRALLEDLVDLRLPYELPGHRHVYHLYAIRAGRRDKLRGFLAEEGVSCGIHYPVPLHLQPALARLEMGPGRFGVAERSAGELLSLPLYPEIRPAQQEYVAERIRSFQNAR